MVAKEAVSWAVAAGDRSEPSFTYILVIVPLFSLSTSTQEITQDQK